MVVLNPTAAGGTALHKWERVRVDVRKSFQNPSVVIPSSSTRLAPLVKSYLDRGTTCFIAAGGDGTVNALVNVIMAIPNLTRQVKLGAIGLGSSNDFHKPSSPDRCVGGIPCKIDPSHTEPRDVGVVRYENSDGRQQERYWILNAGIGLTAAANAYFNRPDNILETLKERWVDAAIVYAAIRTIVRFHNASQRIKVGSEPWRRTTLTNLGVVKSPHFSGSFCYDSPFNPADGRFHVHLCEDMSLAMALATLWRLSQRQFTGLPHTKSWHADRLAVTADTAFPVEFDGEVIHTKHVVFSIAEQRLEVCV